MTFVIYALRLKGDLEVRYIGQTAKTPADRLKRKLFDARSWGRRLGYQSAEWLIRNAGNIEAVEIARVETRAEANVLERQTVGMFLALGHRLFNCWLVPSSRRIDPLARDLVARLAA